MLRRTDRTGFLTAYLVNLLNGFIPAGIFAIIKPTF